MAVILCILLPCLENSNVILAQHIVLTAGTSAFGLLLTGSGNHTALWGTFG